MYVWVHPLGKLETPIWSVNTVNRKRPPPPDLWGWWERAVGTPGGAERSSGPGTGRQWGHWEANRATGGKGQKGNEIILLGVVFGASRKDGRDWEGGKARDRPEPKAHQPPQLNFIREGPALGRRGDAG